MYDYHCHSNFSDDCSSSMEEMILSGISKGVKELAITDHYDPDYPDPAFPFTIPFHQHFELMCQLAQKYASQITLVKGLEIGIQSGSTLVKCQASATAYHYDFLIGSFHCFDGMDLYSADYSNMDIDKALIAFYENMYYCLKDFNDFDVVGHFNVIDRYLPYIPSYTPVRDIIEAILKSLISNGKGIEINTSSYRYSMGWHTTPSQNILTMYKDLGGEILTLGSDAHRPDHIAMDFHRAVAQIKNTGFKYLATYKDRTIKMCPL